MEEFKKPDILAKPAKKVKSDTKDEQDQVEEIHQKYTPEEIAAATSSSPKCPYIEPAWSEVPNENIEYKFEVLKSGTIMEEVKGLHTKSHWVFGRLPDNDIVMAHPTISRYHAVLQYRPKLENDSASNKVEDDKKFDTGWYIYDLESTHGTFVNKMQIPPKTYIRVRVGHMIKLGGSTRSYILQGPEFDEEPESELTITELKELRKQQEEEKRKQIEMHEEMKEKEGISWGMAEDADEETDLTVNPYATTNNEELFLDDPKKTLRGFFEREGLELEYKADEMSLGTFVCRIELPLDDACGKPIVAEVCHKGKKKDCVLQCALEACRILDRHGVLRQAHHEPFRARKPKLEDSDDDDFLDRTGDVERKKLRKASSSQNSVLTYDNLITQEKGLLEKLADVEERILRYQNIVKRSKESTQKDDIDDLDSFMTTLSDDNKLDKTEIRKLRVEQQRLKTDHEKLQRLIKIATPAKLPELSTSASIESKKKSFFPLFGKRSKLKLNIPSSTSVKKLPEKELKSDEEEVEEDEVDDNNTAKSEPKSIKIPVPQKDDEEEEEVPSKKLKEETIKNDEQKKILGPAFIPSEILSDSKSEIEFKDDNLVEEIKDDEKLQNTDEDDDDKSEHSSKETEVLAKKRRSRVRNREKYRENVDIDDAEEFTEPAKYSGWVPPVNQSGDGITSLNKKFGY